MSNYDFSYARRGPLVRIVYLLTALFYRLYKKILRPAKNPCIILCYHAVTAPQMTSFRRQMEYIADRATDLGVVSHSGSVRERICVTFDDGFACLLETAVPITRGLEVPITVFAVTGNTGQPPVWDMDEARTDRAERTMTANELIQLDQEDHCRVESHTVSHPRLADIDYASVRKELRESRRYLEDILGHKVDYLALPHGSYDRGVIELAREAGYRSLLSLDEISDPSNWPEGTMGRFLVSPDMWNIEFRLTADGSYGWLYAWRCTVRRLRRAFGRA